MQLRHAVYIYVMGIHHRYATVTYKWTYGVDMHAVYAQKDGASAYKWSPVLHTNQFCIQMESCVTVERLRNGKSGLNFKPVICLECKGQ